MTLEAPLRTRLAKLVAVLASDHDGEIVAADHELRRTLTRAGLDLHAFAKAMRVGDGFTAFGELERARALYICERIAFALRRKLPVFAGMNLLEAEQNHRRHSPARDRGHRRRHKPPPHATS